MPDGDTPIFDELRGKHELDPLPASAADEPDEFVDDHALTAVHPSWFPSFDHVDSRVVYDPGAPA